jgi:hypothetical protein
MPLPEYNPNSFDAQFAKIFQMLESQNKRHQEKWDEDERRHTDIIVRLDKTNGRVLGLEKREEYAKGKIAGIALVCGGGISILISVVSYFLNT